MRPSSVDIALATRHASLIRYLARASMLNLAPLAHGLKSDLSIQQMRRQAFNAKGPNPCPVRGDTSSTPTELPRRVFSLAANLQRWADHFGSSIPLAILRS
jgi:hypothetical protein